MRELDEVVQEFLVESYEDLDQLERDLLALEERPDSVETLSSVFRTVHTIKGTCGCLGFAKLESLAHVGENLLSKLRDRTLPLGPDMASALLALSDALREMLTSIEAKGVEGDRDHGPLVELLGRLGADAPPRRPRLGEQLVARPGRRPHVRLQGVHPGHGRPAGVGGGAAGIPPVGQGLRGRRGGLRPGPGGPARLVS